MWFNSRLKVSFLPVSNRKYARNMMFFIISESFYFDLRNNPEKNRVVD
jgi:hypothetical protein